MGRRFTPADDVRVAELRRQKLSVIEIAAELDCSTTAVSRALKRTGEPAILKGGPKPLPVQVKQRLLKAAADRNVRRAALARRFGYANERTLNQVVYLLRRAEQAGVR